MDDQALVPHDARLRLQQAGAAANKAAAQHSFTDYQERVAKNTKQNQRRDLAKFTEYLAAATLSLDPDVLMCDPAAWADITWGIVKGFVDWQIQQGCAIASMNRRLSTIKRYCTLAHHAGSLPDGEYVHIKGVQGYGFKTGERIDGARPVTRVGDKKAQPTLIDDEQAEQLKRQPDTLQGRRDALFLCLLIDHGLRVGEVALLQVEHFDMRRRLLTFKRPKVGKIQKHRLSPDTFYAATAYLYGGGPASGPLWYCTNKRGEIIREVPSRQGMRPAAFSVRAMQARIEYLGRVQLGIEKLSPHDLRHLWTTAAIEAGTDIKTVQEAGGWNSPAMPLRYAKSAEIANERMKYKKQQESA
jgi:integrase